MFEGLLTFINSRRKKEGEKHTHTVYGGGEYGGSYTIPKHELDEFYYLLNKSIFEKREKFSIVEKVQDTCPLIIDFDFKYKEKINERQYNSKILDYFVQSVFQKLEILYNISDDQKVCWIMEKKKPVDAPQQGYESKDGIHFLFPYIIAEKKSFRSFRNLLIEEDFHSVICEENLTPPSNSMEEIVDEAIYKGGNWFIYGAGKPNEQCYKLTKILKLNGDSLISLPTDIYNEDPLTIMKLNSVYMNDTMNVEYTEDLNKELKKSTLKNSSSVESISSEDMNPEVMSNALKDDINIAKELALILSPERASSYTDWIAVGYCLHSINHSLLDSWIAFSKKWEMFRDSEECKNQWEWFNRNNNRQITIGTLHYWARSDDPDKYQEIIRESLDARVRASIKGEKNPGAHSDVANVVYHYYKDMFVSTSLKENSWYYFNEKIGGRWEDTEQGHKLRSKLSSEIVDLYMYYQLKWQLQLHSEEEGSDMHNILNNRITGCSKVIIKLKDSGYKDKIMKECREFFYDPSFEDIVDTQLHLLGFENGVYDLEKSVFRPGLPSDYVSQSTGLTLPVVKVFKETPLSELIEYSKEIRNYDKKMADLNDFLEKVFPLKNVRDYTLRFIASCLSGEVREEKFYFWTGSGGNGKSKYVDLIMASFGDYGKVMNISYLTTKRGGAGSASPELELIRKARFVSMTEPEAEDTIYVGKLKEITGGDTLVSRGLFKDLREFKPQFKIILQCNDLPKLGGNDGGVWRRVEVLKYVSKFMDNPRPCEAEPHQYQIDESISQKIQDWKLLFIIMLLEKYPEYNRKPEHGGGTRPPPEVKDATKSYKTKNDLISNWIDDNIVQTEELCPFAELFRDWETWCEDEGIAKAKTTPKKPDIKAALVKLQEKSEHGYVIGKSIGEGAPNGTKGKPKFNFKPVDD
jgi:P4 family phage/plasmid primase-like protien